MLQQLVSTPLPVVVALLVLGWLFGAITVVGMAVLSFADRHTPPQGDERRGGPR